MAEVRFEMVLVYFVSIYILGVIYINSKSNVISVITSRIKQNLGVMSFKQTLLLLQLHIYFLLPNDQK